MLRGVLPAQASWLVRTAYISNDAATHRKPGQGTAGKQAMSMSPVRGGVARGRTRGAKTNQVCVGQGLQPTPHMDSNQRLINK